jgi:hypothetical protein
MTAIEDMTAMQAIDHLRAGLQRSVAGAEEMVAEVEAACEARPNWEQERLTPEADEMRVLLDGLRADARFRKHWLGRIGELDAEAAQLMTEYLAETTARDETNTEEEE